MICLIVTRNLASLNAVEDVCCYLTETFYARFPKRWLTKRHGKLMIYVIDVDGHAVLLICVVFISLYMNKSHLLQIFRVRKNNVLLNILIWIILSKLAVEVKALNIWNVECIWINNSGQLTITSVDRWCWLNNINT